MGNRNRERGFTLIEIVTAMLVMAVIAGAAMMSITSAKQTAKREKQRMMAYIYRLMQKADRTHKNFYIQVASDHLTVNWNGDVDDSFKASDGCSFSYGNAERTTYTYTSNLKGFNGGTINITGADNKTEELTLAVAGASEGRIK